MTLLAFDIGGANLKAADGNGYVEHRAFPLWKQPEQLAGALANMIGLAPPAEQIVITMTGELADCYQTKAEGVKSIVGSIREAAAHREVLVYLTDGRVVEPPIAIEQPLLAAASNWHALAALAARYLSAPRGLLIDLGTTTCDIIPTANSKPATQGRTDPERLASGELVYSGVERTPLFAVVEAFQLNGRPTPLAPEFFATTADAYLLLDQLPEDLQNCDTADGRPRTKSYAHARVARSVCADTSLMSYGEALAAAELVRDAQVKSIVKAVKQVTGHSGQQPAQVVLSGSGEFLLEQVIEALPWDLETVSLSNMLGPEVSRCATAYALALLACVND
ncbi:hydantoinase/oxoprolinase family protein [Adhaeretor mobilis]|uniref:Hydantoinase/oxoprolinase n=1 Tax=Adhaeretor mobilis TaxID=1930276 RepID=A0A517MWZ8_9BACT|nr:hydantoinase/oxoprolinase family protein [Adhaeretor mobilis]QDS99404.1 Hydantoinase/oxoprolinase [Adhaeretor mobilis]